MTLYRQLVQLRPKLAAAAQKVLDDWQPDEDGYDDVYGTGGPCDDIAEALAGVIMDAVDEVYFDVYGHDGDEHMAIVAFNGMESYLVDVPWQLYEIKRGLYDWEKIADARIDASDIVIAPI